MRRAATGSWVARLRLLDDLPLERGGRDLFDLAPLVGLLVDTIVRTSGPLVIHVDGSWGRGKTSFCRLVETELERVGKDEAADGSRVPAPVAAGCSTEVRSARYVASDEQGDGVASLFHAIAKAIAGPRDPEEAARIVRQWGSDAPLGGMRMDAFSTWLRHELGRSQFEPERERVKVPLHPTRGYEGEGESEYAGGYMELDLRPNAQRSAVVFVDDLDRCQRPRVVEVLELIRRFVACPGLVFVIAADRRLIQEAFEDIVERDADLSRTSAAEAMEKYIHRRVELPGFSSFEQHNLARVLEPVQRGLLHDGPGLWLLGIPSADFASGVALPLVQTLQGSLTPRRLKRILNDFAVDMASFADRPQKGAAYASLEAWQDAWKSPQSGFVLKFEATGARLPAYFIGRLLARVCEHLWPGLLAGLLPQDDAFRQRSGRLWALARAHDDFESAVDREMVDELLLALDAGKTTPLRVRRQLLEFFAWVERARREWAVFEREGSPRDPEHGAANTVLRETASNAAAAVVRSKGAGLEAMRGRSVPNRARREGKRDGARVEKLQEVTRGGSPRSGEYKEAAEKLFEKIEHEAELVALADEATTLFGHVDNPEARAELMMKLELVFDGLADRQRLMFLARGVAGTVLSHTGEFASEGANLISLAEVAAARGFSESARVLFRAARRVVLDDSLSALRWGSSYLRFLAANNADHADFDDEVSLELGDLIARMVATEDTLSDELQWTIWLTIAPLVVAPQYRVTTGRGMYRSYRDDLAKRYVNDGGRELTRRYVMLVRAEGGDDPELDQLQSNRATLISASRGDPDIIQAYADILMTRNDPNAWAFARKLYPRLQGKPQWTPQVMHNLATAIHALDPNEDGVGELWIAAYCRAPEDLMIRRALTRFLRTRGYKHEAVAVSRGEPLPDDFNPFDASALLKQDEEPTR